MKISFLFPGQGTQTIGMGEDLYNKYKEVKNIYSKVEEITGIDIKEISFNGPEEKLNETQNTQLAVLTESLAILEILKKNNINADMSAGLSLGEYTALIEDNIFSFEDGVKIVQKRGDIMQNLAPKGNWKMAAILGLDDKKVEEICKNVSNGFVVPANYNTIGQIVISGEEEAVIKAGELAKEKGAKKISLLNTAGPFHTEKLQKCSTALKEEIDKIKFNSKNSKVVKNIDGKLYNKNDNIQEILAKHIMNPVRFKNVLQTMYDNGTDLFIEIGPGKILSSFVKRMKFERNIKIMNINNCKTLEDVIEEVKTNE
mgnify:FL=1